MYKRKIKLGYILAFILGALGVHAFYYGKYIRGILYASISVIFNPLIPLMVILGWVDMFFIKKWHRQFEDKAISTNLIKEEVLTEVKELNDENGRRQKSKTAVISKSIPTAKNNLYYDEEDNILEKYHHLKTPQYILGDINKLLNEDGYSNRNVNGYYNHDTEFAKDSYKYRLQQGQSEVREIPLQAYWTTFKSLNDNQLKWYLYWREHVLNKKYIDVDMSYIILFVYELINYTFNKRAAFNVSMVETLYVNYKERHPKLANYLPKWIADMLYELDEQKLAREWDAKEITIPKLYNILEEELPLGKIFITTWKQHIKLTRETAYFLENRTKVYKIFKSSMELLESSYETGGIRLIEKWFEKRDDRMIRELYVSAVVSRKIEAIHVPVTIIRPTDALSIEITAMLKLSENISRKIDGINRKVKVDEEVLRIGIKEQMEERFLKVKSQTNVQKRQEVKNIANDNNRFKVVKEIHIEELQGSRVPDPSVEVETSSTETKPILSFDDSRITSISNEMNELADLFEGEVIPQNIQDKNIINEPERKTNNESSNLTLLNPLNATENDDGIQDFISALNNIEISFILLFKEAEDNAIAQNRAEQFLKDHSIMLGVFLSELNGKAQDYLGEILFEAVNNVIDFDEEFESVFIQLEERVGS